MCILQDINDAYNLQCTKNPQCIDVRGYIFVKDDSQCTVNCKRHLYLCISYIVTINPFIPEVIFIHVVISDELATWQDLSPCQSLVLVSFKSDNQKAVGDIIHPNSQNNFLQCTCTYIPMLHIDSSTRGDVFKKLKHFSIILGC